MSYICSLESCQKNDFLPFKCNFCNKFYCRKHHPYDKHQCSKYHILISNKRNIELIQDQKCNHQNCLCTINIKKCYKCNNTFCEKHTFPWHTCYKPKKKNFINKLISFFI